MRNITPIDVPRKLEIYRHYNHDYCDNSISNSSITEPSMQVVKYKNQYINTSYNTITQKGKSNLKETKRDSIFRKIPITTKDLQKQLEELDNPIYRNNTSSTITTTVSESLILPDSKPFITNTVSGDTDSLSDFLRNETMTSVDDIFVSRNDMPSCRRVGQNNINDRTIQMDSYFSFDDSIACKGKIDVPGIAFFWRTHPMNDKSSIHTIKKKNNKKTNDEKKKDEKILLKDNHNNIVSFIESYGWKLQQDITL